MFRGSSAGEREKKHCKDFIKTKKTARQIKKQKTKSVCVLW